MSVAATLTLADVTTNWDDEMKVAFQSTVVKVLGLDSTAYVTIDSVTPALGQGLSSPASLVGAAQRRRLAGGVSVSFTVSTQQSGITEASLQSGIKASVDDKSSSGVSKFTAELQQQGQGTPLSQATAVSVTVASTPTAMPSVSNGSSSSGDSNEDDSKGKLVGLGVGFGLLAFCIGGYFAWRHFRGDKAQFHRFQEPESPGGGRGRSSSGGRNTFVEMQHGNRVLEAGGRSSFASAANRSSQGGGGKASYGGPELSSHYLDADFLGDGIHAPLSHKALGLGTGDDRLSSGSANPPIKLAPVYTTESQTHQSSRRSLALNTTQQNPSRLLPGDPGHFSPGTF